MKKCEAENERLIMSKQPFHAILHNEINGIENDLTLKG